MLQPKIHSNARPLEVLKACGGWYKCPKDSNGKRLGPLVGYTGTYDDDGTRRQYVGELFADYAMIEQWPSIANHFIVTPLVAKIGECSRSLNLTAFCGTPEGGKSIAQGLARSTGLRYIYPEKVDDLDVQAAASDRKPTKLEFLRHHPRTDERVAIVEDVCNNFSTTKKLIRLIEESGARVEAVICFLNRSLQWGGEYVIGGREWPVITLCQCPMPEFRQNDPFVYEDMAKGNYFSKPKLRINELWQVMTSAS